MTKAQLLEQIVELRKENTTLRTQLEASTTPVVRKSSTVQDAIKKLSARFPQRKSFTMAEVTTEANS